MVLHVRSLDELGVGATRTRIVRRRAPATGKQVDNADMLYWQLQAMDAHRDWEREYRFHPDRKWRVDLVNPTPGIRLAVEVEGMAPRGVSGRHQMADGFAADAEKYAELAIAGFRLIRVTGRQVKSGKALAWIERAIMAVQER